MGSKMVLVNFGGHPGSTLAINIWASSGKIAGMGMDNISFPMAMFMRVIGKEESKVAKD